MAAAAKLSGSRNKWRHQMTILRVFVAAASAFGMMVMSHDVAGATNSESVQDSIVDRLPADHPIGLGTVITPVSVERAKNLNDATLSTFLVDCPPGASAMLHRMPSPGMCWFTCSRGRSVPRPGMQASALITQERRGSSLLSPTALRSQIRVTNNRLAHSFLSLHKMRESRRVGPP
jgi:hypothetical protein